jgi:hypothetical protein
MLQFRNLPIFVSSPDIPDSGRLPRTKPVIPGGVYPGVGNYYPDEILGDDAIYETRLIDLLDRITQQEVGRLVLSLLPTNYPVLITKMTAADIRRLGDCNGETGASADTISLIWDVISRTRSHHFYTQLHPRLLDEWASPAAS